MKITFSNYNHVNFIFEFKWVTANSNPREHIRCIVPWPTIVNVTSILF